MFKQFKKSVIPYSDRVDSRVGIVPLNVGGAKSTTKPSPIIDKVDNVWKKIMEHNIRQKTIEEIEKISLLNGRREVRVMNETDWIELKNRLGAKI